MIEYIRRDQIITKVDTGEVQNFGSINKAKKFVRSLVQPWLKVKVIHERKTRRYKA